VARKGQKGFKIPDGASSYGSEEQEVLLPPNTKYKVTSIGTVDGTRIIDVEIIEQEPKRDSVDAYADKAEPEPKERSTGLFNEYDSERADEITAESTPLTDLGFDPEEEITIYRGVPDGVDSINAGDWVTTLPQLAKDYAGGGGKVISSKVKAKELLADPSSGEGAYTEEMVYRPAAKTPEPPKPAAPIPTPFKPLPKVQIKEKVKVDRNSLPTPVVEVNEPVYNIFNKDKPVFIQGNIAVPDSPEARALSQIGKDPSKKERDALRKKTLEVLTTDPNYNPLPPEYSSNLDKLTSIGESAYTYVDSSLLINNGLRDADPNMENSKQVKDLDEAMTLSAHLPPGSTVYRMLKLSTWERLNPQPGQVLIDRAYSSTSHTQAFSNEARDIDISTGDVNQIPMRIVMPNNTSGIDLSTISWYDTEDEYLLPRQTALRFLGWDSDGYAVFERIS
jgi:hypothetical protein